MTIHAAFVSRIAAWANGRDDIRLVALIGSQARDHVPADAWSDIDVLLFAQDPSRYIERDDWCSDLGQVVLSFVERTGTGDGLQHRVLFADGTSLDLVPLAATTMRAIAEHGFDAIGMSVVRRGMRILVDKENLAAQIAHHITPAPAWAEPSAEEFATVCKAFWFHAHWATKKLRREEWMTAKSCVDGMMKEHLLQMLQWRTKVVAGCQIDVWHKARFIEHWLDPILLGKLRSVFAHYDSRDIRRAYQATCGLFAEVADETAVALHFPSPTLLQKEVSSLIRMSDID